MRKVKTVGLNPEHATEFSAWCRERGLVIGWAYEQAARHWQRWHDETYGLPSPVNAKLQAIEKAIFSILDATPEEQRAERIAEYHNLVKRYAEGQRDDS